MITANKTDSDSNPSEWTKPAATIAINNNSPPKTEALCLLISPLGIGRSGRSILSSSASKTSLKTTPPPYSPMVANTNNRMDDNEYSGDAKYPEMMTPARISAIAVTIFAGRIKRKKPVSLCTSLYLSDDDRILIHSWLLPAS